jgi:hypothetical protein
MKEQLNKKSIWKVGDKVDGVYFGISFTGTLNDNTRPCPGHSRIQFEVDLDKPLTLFGSTRSTICCLSEHEENSIYRITN